MQTTKAMRAFVYAAALMALACASDTASAQDNSENNSKYDKYIITELPDEVVDQSGEQAEAQTLGERVKNMTMGLLELNDEVVDGGMYMDVAWIMKANPGKAWVTEHSHPFDEVLVFLGTDPEHPRDLNAVIELYINGEKHVLTKSAIVYIPKNTPHCPLIIQKVERPVLFLTTGTTTGYAINE